MDIPRKRPAIAGQSPSIVTEIHGNVREAKCMSCGRRGPMADTLERVLRGEYRFTWGGDWQLSFENAFNSLTNISRLFTLTPGARASFP